MANTKISALNAITGANATTSDLIPIVDVSASETKSITRGELFASPPAIGSTTPAAGSFTTLSATKAAAGSVFSWSAGSSIGGFAYSDVTHAGVYENSGANGIKFIPTSNSVELVTNGAAKATLDSSGNLGLGVTPSAWGNSYKAITVPSNGAIASAGAALGLTANAYFNGTSYIYTTTGTAANYVVNDAGQHVWFTAPSGTAGAAITFTQAMMLDASGNLLPGTTDNVENLGSATYRWATVYAGTGTINTSDAREKTAASELTEAEINAAKQLSKEIGTYKFLASIAAKGDAARSHIGMTVQRAIEIMEANGLKPFDYGFICYDAWEDKFTEHPAIEAVAAVEAVPAVEEVKDEDGNIITAAVPAIPAVEAVEAKDAWTEQTQWAGDRYAFRYDQLNLFIAAGIEARLAALEAK